MEEWRDIAGYEGLYQVSDLGRVKGIKSSRVLRNCKKPKGFSQKQYCKYGRNKTRK